MLPSAIAAFVSFPFGHQPSVVPMILFLASPDCSLGPKAALTSPDAPLAVHDIIQALYKSSSESSPGRGRAAASSISLRYCSISNSSTWAVGGARAISATNSCNEGQRLARTSSGSTAPHPAQSKQTYQAGVPNKLAGQPQEGLLKVVVGLGRNIVVLEVLLPVEGDGLGLDLAFLDVDLVAAEDDGDVFANADEITWNRG
jgi:hypothetical protein